jgi:hypothetical protein
MISKKDDTVVATGIAGSTVLPNTVTIHRACNPSDQAAAGRKLSLPEVTRVLRLEEEAQKKANGTN